MQDRNHAVFDVRTGSCRLAVLIDPEKTTEGEASARAALSETVGAACILLGGTYVQRGAVSRLAEAIRRACTLPVILFPGASPPVHSLSKHADGFLCPIVYTTQQPWFLTGWHIEAAPLVRQQGLVSIPMGYILVGDRPTATAAISATCSLPVARHDNGRAVVLAQTAAMMGMSFVYLDAGSGAEHAVPRPMIRDVRSAISVPLAVGGGLRDAEAAGACAEAGADWIVVGNALENTLSAELLVSMVVAINSAIAYNRRG